MEATFEHNGITYGVDIHGRLFELSNGIWGNVTGTPDKELTRLAEGFGWIQPSYICGGFHNHVVRLNP